MCVLAVLCLYLDAQQPALKPLSIGDTVPDITLTNVYNYPASTIHLSDLKGKLVILDFMTTGCVSCIEALPRFDSIQRQFNNNVIIFLVSPESNNRVQSFLRRKNISNLKLPAIASDTMLSQLFPHTYIPHDVVVKNGVVKAITYPEYIVSKNVESIIEDENLSLPIKRDISEFQYQKPLLQLNENVIPDFSYPGFVAYSAVSSYLDNVPWRYTTTKDTVNNILRISIINVPILDLYIKTLCGGQLPPAFITLNVSDTDSYVYNEAAESPHDWIRKNTYCYEGSFPLNYPLSVIRQKIGNDLDFYFKLHGRMVKKKIACWIISNAPASSLIQKNNLVHISNPSDNSSINDIIFYMNKNFGNTPAIDETGNGELRIQGLNRSQCTNIPLLKKKLHEYGLQITLKNMLVDMLEIDENNHNIL